MSQIHDFDGMDSSNDNTYYWGTIRIKNPKTLQSWIDKGWYQERIDAGLIFNVGCGRFREHKCTCSACRTRTRPKLQEIINQIKP